MSKPNDYTPEQLIELMTTGAQASGAPSLQAAVHLITFTELPHRADFIARHLELDQVAPMNGPLVTGAFVRDWESLARLDGLPHVPGGDERFVALASSLAAGIPVDLREAACGFGVRRSGRMLEAFAIAADVTAFYTITDTGKFATEQAAIDQMLPTGGTL